MSSHAEGEQCGCASSSLAEVAPLELHDPNTHAGNSMASSESG